MKLKSTTYYWLAVILGGVGMGAAMGAEGTAQTTGYISGTLFAVSLAAVRMPGTPSAAQRPREWPQSGRRPLLLSLSPRPMKNARSPQKRSKRHRPMQPSRRMAGWISACFRNSQSLHSRRLRSARNTASG